MAERTDACGSCTGDCSSCGTNDITVTVNMDDGSVVECAILTIYEAGGRDYIALLPLTDEGEADGNEVYLYRYTTTESGPALENIESDDEYEIAADRFDEMLDELQYEEDLGSE
ncbi:MAG: DUF1292 domain-containing protein [Lachnospiraceae bacterium]|nr:DUF1292 domain-containing protein [Lachnospiraceae bacterium]